MAEKFPASVELETSEVPKLELENSEVPKLELEISEVPKLELETADADEDFWSVDGVEHETRVLSHEGATSGLTKFVAFLAVAVSGEER